MPDRSVRTCHRFMTLHSPAAVGYFPGGWCFPRLEGACFRFAFMGGVCRGVVSASQMMSVATFHQGLHARSFPSFGSERMGAPVTAFVRVDETPIELREPVLDPDLLIVQDSTLSRP